MIFKVFTGVKQEPRVANEAGCLELGNYLSLLPRHSAKLASFKPPAQLQWDYTHDVLRRREETLFLTLKSNLETQC